MSVDSQRAKAEQRVGKRFGALTVKARAGANAARRALYLCECDCGAQVVKTSEFLGKSKKPSCGCKTPELQSVPRKHGFSRRKKEHPMYGRWKQITDRCRNPNNSAYRWYGAKGVRVCEEWHQFEKFYQDMGEPPTPDAEIDRVDPTGPYSKDNCRWLPKRENILRSKPK